VMRRAEDAEGSGELALADQLGPVEVDRPMAQESAVKPIAAARDLRARTVEADRATTGEGPGLRKRADLHRPAGPSARRADRRWISHSQAPGPQGHQPCVRKTPDRFCIEPGRMPAPRSTNLQGLCTECEGTRSPSNWQPAPSGSSRPLTVTVSDDATNGVCGLTGGG
jgi:hypothetical protein